MRRALIAALLALTGMAGSAWAADLGTPSQEAALREALDQLRRAMVDPTPEALDRLVDDELLYLSTDSKAEFIETMQNGRMDYRAIEIRNIQVHSIGGSKGLAIVQYDISVEAFDKRDARHRSFNEKEMDVWILRDGQWKLWRR